MGKLSHSTVSHVINSTWANIRWTMLIRISLKPFSWRPHKGKLHCQRHMCCYLLNVWDLGTRGQNTGGSAAWWWNVDFVHITPLFSIIMKLQWARWCLKSPTWFTQPFVQAWIKENIKLRVTGRYKENLPVTGEFPARRASSVEIVSILRRHQGTPILFPLTGTP